MAKHFREEPTQAMPRTRRAHYAEDAEDYPYGPAASYRTHYAGVAGGEETYDGYVYARGGIAKLGRGICLLIAWAFRLLALAGCALVILNAMPYSPWRSAVTQLLDLIWSKLPWGELPTLTVDTPFGGSFLIPLALATLLCLVLDWLMCRARARLC